MQQSLARVRFGRMGAGIKRRIAVPTDERLSMPGALLTRQYKGRSIRVRALPSGFDCKGTVYRSRSATKQEQPRSDLGAIRTDPSR